MVKGGAIQCLGLLLALLLVGMNLSLMGKTRKSAMRQTQDTMRISQMEKAISVLQSEMEELKGNMSMRIHSVGSEMAHKAIGFPSITKLRAETPEPAKRDAPDAMKPTVTEPQGGKTVQEAAVAPVEDTTKQVTRMSLGGEGMQRETKVPVAERILLPNGLQNGSCVEVPLVYKGGGPFRINLQSGRSLDDPTCTYGEKDLVHMHVRLGNPSNDVAYAGALANWDGKELGHRQKNCQFKDRTIGHVGKPITTRICAENERWVVHTNGEFSIRVQQWWDLADIRCLTIAHYEKVSANGDVTLTNMPTSPAKRDCIFTKCEKTMPPPEPFTAIDYGLFINMEHRHDRRTAMEKALQAANIPFQRIPGFDMKKHPELVKGCFDMGGQKVCTGQLGCQRGHLAAIEKAMADKRPYAAIFEDDFRWHPWVKPSEVGKIVTALMNKFPDWDAIGLSLNIEYEEPAGTLDVDCLDGKKCQVMRVLQAQAPSGYILRDTIYKQVHHRFSEGYCNVRESYPIMTDYCWKGLQHYHKFYAFEPQMGTQAASFSDIEHTHVNYKDHLSR